ncbi:MAG TPA: AI-2E family transporter [Candidatus Binatia bacterium]|nr:AI-2E family transporter [Candidatus Binatia bacterium]
MATPRTQPGEELPTENVRAVVLFTLGAVAAAGLLAWILFLARQVLLLVYVSGLLATGFSPLVRLIERQRFVGSRVPRWVAILVVYVGILAALGAIAFIVLPPLVAQTEQFAVRLPELLGTWRSHLVRSGILPRGVTVGEMVQQAPGTTNVVGTVALTLWTLTGGVLGLITILFLTFYLLVDSEDLVTAFVRLFPRPQRPAVQAAAREVTRKVSAWLTGQLILAGVIGTTTAIGLGLIGIPYFYVLAVIAAVGELIPYIGPILAALPGILVAATVSWKLALGVAAFYFVQQNVEASLLVPKLMERQVGLSAVTVLIALLVGAAILGVAGAILAVPTAAILRVVALVLSGEEIEEDAGAAR